jgi:PhoH-like ATPase
MKKSSCERNVSMQKVFVDTNILLNNNFSLKDYSQVYISIVTIEELDNLKRDDRLGYQAREAIRNIINADNVEIKLYDPVKTLFTEQIFTERKNDNLILNCAKDIYDSDNEVVFISDDYAMILKARGIELPCEMFELGEDEEVYNGWKEVILTEEEMSLHYQIPTNIWNLVNNQYLVIKNNNGLVVDKQKWTEKNGFSSINYRQIDNLHIGKIKPKNIQQELVFDLFQNKNIKICAIFGKHGTGKDYIMSAHALQMVQKGLYERIIFLRNNYIVRNTRDTGFLPGELVDKLLPFAMPLADHIGGVDGLEMFINQGKIEIQHLGFIRGRDIKNSIIYCTEAENMTKEHIQLLISRLAEGSSLWLNGDFKQIDHSIFEKNNGLKQVINILKGNELFGCVELDIVERSNVAQLAELLG